MITDRSQLPGYDPISEPKKTFQTEVAAFAVLTVLAAGGVVGALGGGSSVNSGSMYGRRDSRETWNVPLAPHRFGIHHGSA